jgi:hypothetical protein
MAGQNPASALGTISGAAAEVPCWSFDNKWAFVPVESLEICFAPGAQLLVSVIAV